MKVKDIGFNVLFCSVLFAMVFCEKELMVIGLNYNCILNVEASVISGNFGFTAVKVLCVIVCYGSLGFWVHRKCEVN